MGRGNWKEGLLTDNFFASRASEVCFVSRERDDEGSEKPSSSSSSSSLPSRRCRRRINCASSYSVAPRGRRRREQRGQRRRRSGKYEERRRGGERAASQPTSFFLPSFLPRFFPQRQIGMQPQQLSTDGEEDRGIRFGAKKQCGRMMQAAVNYEPREC